MRLTTSRDGAALTWKASPAADVARYLIYRGEGANPWDVTYHEVGRVPVEKRAFRDTGLRTGQVYFYTVRAADAAGRLGPESAKVRTRPRLVEEAVVSVLSPREVELTWTPPPGEDVVGYHVERAVVEVWSEDQLQRLKKRTPPLAEPAVGSLRRVGAFRQVGPELVKEPRFTDNVDLSKPQTVEGAPLWEPRFAADHLDARGTPYGRAVFAYRVRAVNALGVEGGPSPYFLTIPSAPQHVFSRERGTKCDLKWAKNPEKGLRGYRVYRLDGRFDDRPVSRLTPDPIAGPTFTDETAGKVARRYHLVAVDALGQEGLPSAPVWFEREWKVFYRPFTGEWHQ
jgi:hypothetical protein